MDRDIFFSTSVVAIKHLMDDLGYILSEFKRKYPNREIEKDKLYFITLVKSPHIIMLVQQYTTSQGDEGYFTIAYADLNEVDKKWNLCLDTMGIDCVERSI